MFLYEKKYFQYAINTVTNLSIRQFTLINVNTNLSNLGSGANRDIKILDKRDPYYYLTICLYCYAVHTTKFVLAAFVNFRPIPLRFCCPVFRQDEFVATDSENSFYDSQV